MIRTPNATIGVRGTDHEATVILTGDNRGYPAGTYDKVNQGITFIRTDKGEIDIHPDQAGFAANMVEMPALLKEIPEFYKNDSSMKDQNSMSEQGKKGEGLADKKTDGHSREQAGKGAEFSRQPETESTSSESPGRSLDMDIPESSAPAETPDAPSLPELPETPSLPETPETPTLPEAQ